MNTSSLGSALRQASSLDPRGVAAELVARAFAGVESDVAVSLEDGTPLHVPAGPIATTIVVRDPSALRSIFSGSQDLAAGEAFLRGDLAVRGDVERGFAALDAIVAARSPKDWLTISRLALRLPRTRRPAVGASRRGPAQLRGRVHTRERDRAAVSYHYDVSNEFFALWLGRELTYSCAYFRTESDSLDDAQRNKFDHICRKLRLKHGERLLDVGCGWGGLVRFAAREYGARGVGVTLSANQVEYGRKRIAEEGLDGQCAVELRDYRDLASLGRFDKAVSVGMVEHVGAAMLPLYFRSVFDALVPDGLFLNHGITTQVVKSAGLRSLLSRTVPARSRFIERYVFPDGELLHLDAAADAAERAGFEIRDVENLREHYARTLRFWVRRLEDREDEARALVGDETYNVWRLYMGGSARSFAVGRLGLIQMLLAKKTADGRTNVPMTRGDIYAT